jgi:hypothetical protein
MAFRLTALWVLVAAASGWGAWLLAKRASRAVCWIRLAVAAVLLVGLAASFLLLSASVEKSLASVLLYFLVWSTAFVITGLSAGVVVGTLVALYLI